MSAPSLQRFRYEGGDLGYEPPESAPADWDGNLGDLIGDYFRAEDVEALFSQSLSVDQQRLASKLKGMAVAWEQDADFQQKIGHPTTAEALRDQAATLKEAARLLASHLSPENSGLRKEVEDLRDFYRDKGSTTAAQLIAARLDAVLASPENSSGVEEGGYWRIETADDWLSRYHALNRADAILNTAERLREFFKDEGEPCTDGEAAEEAAEIIDAAKAAPNAAREQDGVCVTYVATQQEEAR